MPMTRSKVSRGISLFLTFPLPFTSSGLSGSNIALTLFTSTTSAFLVDILPAHAVSVILIASVPPSSRGLGHRPFKPATWIRIPLGAF